MIKMIFQRDKDGKYWVNYTLYEERFGRRPENNNAAFHEDITLAFVNNLKGNLLNTRQKVDGYVGRYVAMVDALGMQPVFTLDEILAAQDLLNEVS